MRHNLLALALAAASLAFTAPGHAGPTYADGTYGHYQQTCITKRVQTQDQHGKAVTKRVRICQ
jgi:hypothetical protein